MSTCNSTGHIGINKTIDTKNLFGLVILKCKQNIPGKNSIDRFEIPKLSTQMKWYIWMKHTLQIFSLLKMQLFLASQFSMYFCCTFSIHWVPQVQQKHSLQWFYCTSIGLWQYIFTVYFFSALFFQMSQNKVKSLL